MLDIVNSSSAKNCVYSMQKGFYCQVENFFADLFKGKQLNLLSVEPVAVPLQALPCLRCVAH